MKLVLACVMFCLAMMPGLANAQRAIVNGTVVDENGVPMPGVSVIAEALLYGASTDLNGQYELSIPGRLATGQELELKVYIVGMLPASKMIVLERGVQSHDFLLEYNPELWNVGLRVFVSPFRQPLNKAFSASRLGDNAFAQVPGESPVSSLQGKIAGVSALKNSGTPGDAWSLRLRGTTSVTGSNQPLFIVDGVYLSADQVDLDAIDIASVEVIKGIAGATEYGSRGQSGVVLIETQRGRQNVPLNGMRVTLRNEIGLNNLSGSVPINQSHNLRLSPEGGFVDNDGNAVPYGNGTVIDNGINGVSFYDNPFPGTTFNAADQFFKRGIGYTNYIAVSGNNAKTNYHGSFTNLSDAGIIQPWKGFNRQAARVNVDHRVLRNLSFSGAGSFGISSNDAPTMSPLGNSATLTATGFNPIGGAILSTPVTDLRATNATGSPLAEADALAQFNNPFYIFDNTEFSTDRTRILGRIAGTYAPTSWLKLEASAAYDRAEQDQREVIASNFVFASTDFSPGAADYRRKLETETLLYEADAFFDLYSGPWVMNGRLGYRHEGTDGLLTFSGITEPGIIGVDIENEFSGETRGKILADVWIAAAGVSYKNSVLLEGMFVQEGNSLFGAEERWQQYYRVGGAFQFNIFKLFAGYGTAGGRPRFDAQYPLFREQGAVILGSRLGNRALRPERTTGLELGLDVSISDRVSLQVIYEDRKTEDLLFFVPLPGFFNVEGQWQNAGTLESNVWEANLRATVLHSSKVSLDLGITVDKVDQELTQLSFPGFSGGPLSAFYFEEGTPLGTLYGTRALTSLDELPAGLSSTLFDVNDDGYVVAVGAGNTYEEGIEKSLWGTTVVADGTSYAWGIPVIEGDETGQARVPVGKTTPDLNIGLPVNFRYGGWKARMLWNAQIGGDVFNYTRYLLYQSERGADLDQAGKADRLKKPAAYYAQLGQTTSHFVEDGSFVKLREIAVSYSFNYRQLSTVLGTFLKRLTVGVTARNLLTTSTYSGFDPEVGTVVGNAGNVGADATLYRYDQLGYPTYRTFTAKLEIQF
ncbi:MAG: TonB-dependent receptor plug domain-containing protein [Bacteroidota bacterium]